MPSPTQPGVAAHRRDVVQQLEGLEFAVHRPRSPVVDEVRRFRGEVIWNGGTRPAFRGADGSFADARAADPDSYHVVLREAVQRSMVACIALAPLESLPESAVRSWSPALSARLLAERGADESAVLEAARLVVARRLRGRGLGQLLVITAFALAQARGRRMIWGTAGTRQHQHLLLIATGMGIREEFGRRHVPELEDTLCVVAGEPSGVPVALRGPLAQLRSMVEQRGEAA
jgi:GNAT superfamily N-acetyltransferase